MRFLSNIVLIFGCVAMFSTSALAQAQPKAEATDTVRDAEVTAEKAREVWQKLLGNSEEIDEAKVILLEHGPDLFPYLTDIILDGPKIDPAKVRALVKQLDAASYAKREKAMDALEDMGAPIANMISDILKNDAGLSAEVNVRLRALQNVFKRNKINPAEARRLKVFGEVISEFRSRDALEFINTLEHQTTDQYAKSAFRKAQRVLVMGIAEDESISAMQLARQGKLAVAELLAKSALDLANDYEFFEPTAIETRYGIVSTMHEAAKYFNQAIAKEQLSEKEQRTLLFTALAELDDTRRAAQVLETYLNLKKKYGLTTQKLSQLDQNQSVESYALAWQEIARSQFLSDYGKARALVQTREAWQKLQEIHQSANDAKQAEEATKKALAADHEILRLGRKAYFLGIQAETTILGFVEGDQLKQVKYANIDGYSHPTQWLVLGPLPKEAFKDDPPRPDADPKSAISPNAQFRSLTPGKKVAWQEKKFDFQIIPGDEKDSVYYLYTEIVLKEDSKDTFLIGCDDTGELYINGKKVWESSPQGKSWSPTEAKLQNVQLKAGVNRIFFRLENFSGAMGFSLARQDTNRK